MFMVYNHEAIYLAAIVEENDFDNIMIRNLERDSYSKNEDGICFVIDAYNDDRTAYGFIVTPAGVKTDVSINNDAESHGGWNTNWNTFWDASVSKNKNGWIAEIRIPFSSLRFENGTDKTTMGIILWRFMARNSEYNIFPKIPNRWNNSYLKPSQALDVDFEEINKTNPMFIKPYVIGGLTQNSYLNVDSSNYDLSKDWNNDFGVDVKYNITSNIILDLTYNTDFAQVEIDDQRFNTTRFSLFSPEKREFFQERADLFTYRFPGGPQRLFQSRRIGIVDGKTVPIIGGMRLTGKVKGWEFGLIEMQTEKITLDEDSFASENFGVLRIQHEVFNPGSYVGTMITNRTDFDISTNTVYAFDADIRYLGQHYARLLLGKSFDSESNNENSDYISLILQKRIKDGYSYGLSFSHYGEQFDPALGFFNRTGIDRFGSRLQYTWFPGSSSILQSHTLSNRLSSIWDTENNRMLETFGEKLFWDGLLKSGAKIKWSLDYTRDAIIDSFDVGEIVIVPKKYSFIFGEVGYEMPQGDQFQLKLDLGYGQYYGGKRVKLEINPSLTINKYATFSFIYDFEYFKINNNNLSVSLIKLRLSSALNNKISMNSFVQYNNEIDMFSANIRLRYNPTEGSDLYLVYNQNFNTIRTPEERKLPMLPVTQSRSVQLKYNYTFTD